MKTILSLIIFLISFATFSDDIIVSDYISCGIILRATGDSQLGDLIITLDNAGVTPDDINKAIHIEFKRAIIMGEHNWIIEAKQLCKKLGYIPPSV